MIGKPWLEKHDHADVRETLVDDGYTEEWVAFFCAAPAMARALCLVEWRRLLAPELQHWECNACGARATIAHTIIRGTKPEGHVAGCWLDEALSQAGLDRDAREEVRKAGGRA